MGKDKKFFEKKKSATFQLVSQDSSDSLFLRVDTNNYTPASSFNNVDQPPQTTAFPEHIRNEILELGFPDDGYNYLKHIREIKGSGYYYRNPNPNFDQLPIDIKAYDASSLEVSKIIDVRVEESVYRVASMSAGVILEEVMDHEIAAMLDVSDLFDYVSDDGGLEEDFVVNANRFEGDSDEGLDDEKLGCAMGLMVDCLQIDESIDC